jgi:hypothetical protein
MLAIMPIIGSILLTLIIVWIIVSSVVAHRRKIRSALAGHSYCVIANGNHLMPEHRKSICCGAETFRPRWTADGWVAPCQNCGEWQYLGDDYDHPPEDALIPSSSLPAPRPSDASRPDGLTVVRPEVTSDDQGEPLPASMSHTPNVGGEGQPEYAGPHYDVEHDRFVPYDVLRDPIPGAAVHIVGNVACVGPLEDESQGETGHAESAENDIRSD